ncbi:hypothetical protein CVT24_000922 [Panaeolus cyanescens]|uniref:N-acetyltransferase domain-containing protein n=1 Tax=Panaeolus cyanescens TaxID=181874 RepID=A0A409YTC7_9AGAR|nr:hypothetical protein CVT24_000922 [Panaeolus cyanescens]
MIKFTVQRVESPSEELISSAVDLFYSLMNDDQAAISLCGGDTSLFKLQIRAMVKAAVLDGEFYTATNEEGRLIGYSIWMPPGQEMFSTEEQRALGFNEFVSALPQAGMDYFKNTYLAHFPGFVNQHLGPTGKRDAWWLHNLAVAPEYQRNGIARAIVDVVKEKASIFRMIHQTVIKRELIIQAKAKGEMLATSTTNDKNVPVYVNMGFTINGSMTMPSPWGDWPLHVFSLDTSKLHIISVRSTSMREANRNFETRTLLSDDDDFVLGKEAIANEARTSKVSVFAAAFVVLFFIIDIYAFFSVGKILLDARNTVRDPDTMELRNPYIGLDELYSFQSIKPSAYAPIINEPRMAAQVSPAEPKKVFPFDEHRWLSDFGRLSPPDRRTKVTSDVHTIAQFNVLDYGMEKCALAVRLPNRGDVLPHQYTLPTSRDTVRLNICQLDAHRPLKERTLSWATKPACSRDLGVIEAKVGGEVEMQPFYCKSGDYLTYQISCAEESFGCDIDVWTNQNQTWGLFIRQYQTV